jgi:hypothetical protein
MADIDPSATSADYDAQIAYWDKVDAILAGEDAIKAATTTYLPKFANEKQAVYDYRLNVSPFTNIASDISRNLASKPFAEDLKLEDDTDERFKELSENIDGQGNNLHTFAASLFQDSLNKGIAYILVEFTKARPREDGRVLSLGEEKAQNLRPYWVHIPAQSMLAIYDTVVGGEAVIYHARISEMSTQVDAEFKEVETERVRHLSREPIYDEFGTIVGFGPATWTVWERATGGDGRSAWSIVDQGEFSVGFIPLVPVMLEKRQGLSWLSPSPIRGIFDMQITQYRQESNLEWVKVMTCFPMFCVSGMETKNSDGSQVEVTVGPNTVFLIPQNGAGTGPAGEVTVVETSGSASAELRNQLELFRKEMRDLGMQPLAVANLTVTLSNHVTKKASSQVEKWALLFKDALESAWKYTAAWLGDSAEPEVVIHTDFAIEQEQGDVLGSLLKAEAQGLFSKETLRAEFKRRNAVSNDVDEEEEQERLAAEQEALEPEVPIDPVTGEPIPPAPNVIQMPPRKSNAVGAFQKKMSGG